MSQQAVVALGRMQQLASTRANQKLSMECILLKLALKPPIWKTGSTSFNIYRPHQQQHSNKQWAVDLGV